MEKKEKIVVNDLESWLLSLEAHVGKPLVVSLVVDKDVKFLSCTDKKAWFDEKPYSEKETALSDQDVAKHDKGFFDIDELKSYLG